VRGLQYAYRDQNREGETQGKLLGRKGKPGVCVRLVPSPSPSNPAQLKMIPGTPKAQDHVVESEDGLNLLLVGADLLPTLEGMVIDFRETRLGTGFTVSRIPPEK